jgi:hypothetical protein
MTNLNTNQTQLNQSQSNLKKLFLAFIITLALPFCFPPIANAAPKYKPPRRVAPIRTDSTGTRSMDTLTRIGNLKGCAQDLAVPMTLLVPEQPAQTTAGRPPLFWYLAGQKDVIVTLYELPEKGNRKALWSKSVKVEQPGIAQLTFPAEQPELAIGKVYAWSIELVCDDLDVAQNSGGVQAQFERVAASTWLTEQLKKAPTDQRRAELYATSGQWYDTLDATAKALTADPENKTIQQDLISLIEQVGLKNVADREK